MSEQTRLRAESAAGGGPDREAIRLNQIISVCDLGLTHAMGSAHGADITGQNFHTKAALMICSARANLPQAFTRNGDIKENRWVSRLSSLSSHNTCRKFFLVIPYSGLYIDCQTAHHWFFNLLMLSWMNCQIGRKQCLYRINLIWQGFEANLPAKTSWDYACHH